MPEATFVHPDGKEETVSGREGESLMQVAVQAGLAGIEGECGGEMSCGTCHVWVDDEWQSSLKPPLQDELDLLEVDENFTERSRLSCQIPLDAGTDGIVAHLPLA